MMRKRLIAVLLAACMLVLLAGCAGKGTEPQKDPVSTEDATSEVSAPTGNPALDAKQEAGPRVTPEPLAAVRAAASYEEIRTAFSEAYHGIPTRGAGAWNSAALGDDGVEAPAAEGGADYGTNVQVSGVDEADSLKTDGTYLYVMTDNGFRILRADGPDTEILAEVVYEADAEDTYISPAGLFIGENRVALLYDYNRWGTDKDGAWFDETRTGIAVYDVTQKDAPVLISDVGQDGGFRAARLLNGTILLVTEYYVGYPDDNDVRTFIPCTYRGGEGTLLAADRIFLCPQAERTSFAVVGSYDLADGTPLDECAFTDGIDQVYMNADALYLTRTVTAQTASEPYTENQYTVTDYVQQRTTEIKRLELTDGKLTLTASGSVPGSLLNQFSMDFYDGCLRLATTTYTEAYSVYLDENYGWENYVWYDSTENNRVTVLDGELQELGVLEDMVADEQIYSVRFLGQMGYVVTYESIDPVFTVDLSDPTQPRLESALEVPGVSQYLHPFTEGRLFGFGQAVDEHAASEGLQLAMFDVSDPRTVTMEARTVTEYDYSEALYDHHAILVSAEQNLIGFAAESYGDNWGNEYVLYRYDDGAFTKLGSYDMPMSAYNLRAVSLNGYLYLCSRYAADVVDLSSLESVATLTDAVG